MAELVVIGGVLVCSTDKGSPFFGNFSYSYQPRAPEIATFCAIRSFYRYNAIKTFSPGKLVIDLEWYYGIGAASQAVANLSSIFDRWIYNISGLTISIGGASFVNMVPDGEDWCKISQTNKAYSIIGANSVRVYIANGKFAFREK